MAEELILDGPIVMRSPRDNYRIKLEVNDDGSLWATLLIRDPNSPNRWNAQHSGQGQKCLARADRSHIDSRVINFR